MQKREKILMIVLASALAFVVVWPILKSVLLGPVAGLRTERDRLVSQIDRQEDRQTEILTAVRRLGEWTENSLPPSADLAQNVYHIWLVKLAQVAGCSTPEVALENPVRQGEVFTTVPVKLTMQGTLDQLTRFVALFESTRLTHSISYLSIASPAFDGDPRFELIVRCQGISVQNADPRTRLFPQGVLAREMSESARSITLESDAEFADLDELEGERIRIGTELLKITEVDGTTWRVERGVDGTIPVTADAGEIVELMPRRDDYPEDPMERWEELLAANPFTKPDPPFVYNPRIADVEDQLVIQGLPWSLTLDAPGWDPESGSPLFAFDSDVPEGLTLDRSTGELTWETDETTPVGDWDVTVKAVASRNPAITASTEFLVSLRMVNLPPIVTIPSRLTAFSGQPVEIPFTAIDPDGDSEDITFTPAGDQAESIEVNEETGIITFTPALELDLGEYAVEVDVEDGGDPPAVVTARVRVEVMEDDAFFTHYVGLFTIDGRPEAHFYNRMTRAEGYFLVGDRLEVGNVAGEIVSISPDQVVLRNEEELFSISNGGNLREKEVLETYETSGETDESEDLPEDEASGDDANGEPEPDAEPDTEAESDSPAQPEEPEDESLAQPEETADHADVP